MPCRAAASIQEGEEVTMNYLGRGTLSPVYVRQEELEGIYGFRCKCVRCRCVRMGFFGAKLCAFPPTYLHR